jgi:hypothetical protein
MSACLALAITTFAQFFLTAAADVSIQGYGDHDKSCAEWTDGCRTCRRDEAGEPVCSNIGPSCQPAAITCMRKVEPAR